MILTKKFYNSKLICLLYVWIKILKYFILNENVFLGSALIIFINKHLNHIFFIDIRYLYL